MLLPAAFEEYLSGICDIEGSLVFFGVTHHKHQGYTKLNEYSLLDWFWGPMSSSSLSPMPPRCNLGQMGGCAPIRIFPATLSYDRWEQNILDKGNWNWTLKSVQEKGSGSQPLEGGSKQPVSGDQLYLGLVIQSMVIQHHLPLVCGIAPEVSLKLLDKR